MTYEQATGQETSYQDQDGQDYIRDERGFAISVWGHYTIEELKAKVAQLEEANRFYQAGVK